MAVLATDLTLPATVASELGVLSSDPLLERYIRVASDAVRTYLNRGAVHYSAAVTETVAGYGTPRLSLSRLPVASIASITVVDDVVDPSEYVLENGDAGVVYRASGWTWSALRREGLVYEPLPGTEEKNITVVYAAGWVTPGQENLAAGVRDLPYDLEEAVIQTVVALYRGRGSDGNIASESLGAASVSYRDGRTVLPPVAQMLLTPYRLSR